MGRRRSAPRWPRPSWRTASTPGAYHRIRSTGPTAADGRHRDHPARAAAGLRGAGRPPRRRALPAAVRHDRAHAAVRRRGAGARPPAGRAGQGPGHRDGLHLRRPDRRRVVARARAADPRGHRPRRPDPAPSRRTGRSDGRAAYAELAGKTVVHGPGARSSSCCASPATWSASPRPIAQPVKFYEKGDKPLEIVSSRQWYIRNGGRDAELRDGCSRRGARAALAPGVHAGPVRELGRAA